MSLQKRQASLNAQPREIPNIHVLLRNAQLYGASCFQNDKRDLAMSNKNLNPCGSGWRSLIYQIPIRVRSMHSNTEIYQLLESVFLTMKYFKLRGSLHND